MNINNINELLDGVVKERKKRDAALKKLEQLKEDKKRIEKEIKELEESDPVIWGRDDNWQKLNNYITEEVERRISNEE